MQTATPVFPYLYSGDFNCQHTDWGYNTISANGECLVDWATKNNLILSSSQPQGTPTLEHRANPDLATVSTSGDSS